MFCSPLHLLAGLGACGITNNDQQFIAAVSHSVFDFFPGYNGGNPNSNPVCNKKVQVTYQGKQITVAITDRCVGCMPGDLDFSPAAFSALANPALGRIDILWEWLN
ncbi:barwin-like endoglucanase [Tricholoma matsutake]|nr:barwin-like endoglucanase [Tricholoma matsutake 945]KAF8237780.1 barwin-like endoglucanase [Tricholoma matsutake 945]